MPGGYTSLARELSCSHKITSDPATNTCNRIWCQSLVHIICLLHIHETPQAVQVVCMQQDCCSCSLYCIVLGDCSPNLNFGTKRLSWRSLMFMCIWILNRFQCEQITCHCAPFNIENVVLSSNVIPEFELRYSSRQEADFQFQCKKVY